MAFHPYFLPDSFLPGSPRRARFRHLFLLASTLALAAGCAPRAPTYERPPIILVDIDTLRADHLGCYGYERDTSPEIDAFAESAALFEWAFSQGPNTPPSQSSILSALYPSAHGRIRRNDKMREDVETLAERLGDAGYRTAAFVDGGLMSAGFGLEQGFELYDDQPGGVRKMAPKAERWIDDHLRNAETAEQPFFLLLHTYDVHSPYERTPKPFRERYLDDLDEPPTPSFRVRTAKKMMAISKARYQHPYPQLAENDLRYAEALYDGGIRHVDHWFGELRRFLESRGLYDQAIVVVISDHGDSFQEHGLLFHSQIYAPVTRIPFLVRFPGGRLAGVYPPVVESIDLMPTLLERVGVASPPGIHGQSLLPYLEGRAEASSLDRTAISESPYYGRRLAVADDEHRLLITESGYPPRELFAYRADPLEQRDLAAEKPERAAELRRTLDAWRRDMVEAARPRESVDEVDAELMEQLVLLGYVDPGESVAEEEADGREAPPELFRDGFESGELDAWPEAERP